MKNFRVLAVLTAVVMFVGSNLTLAAGDAPLISLSNVTAAPGEVATVAFELTDNPGLAGLGLSIGYASALSLESTAAVKRNAALERLGFTGVSDATVRNNPFSVNWVGTDDNSEGLLLTVEFVVSAAAKPGDYPITVAVEEAVGKDLKTVAVTVRGGVVTVRDPSEASLTLGYGWFFDSEDEVYGLAEGSYRIVDSKTIYVTVTDAEIRGVAFVSWYPGDKIEGTPQYRDHIKIVKAAKDVQND